MNKKTLRRFHVKLLAVIVLGTLAFPLRSVYPEETVKRPNIILITVDTLRADHLGSYGYNMKTSPNIDRFALDGMLFENCLSHGPDTWTSLASMLTGFLPHETKIFSQQRLPARVETLAEILKLQEYKTLAVVSNYILRRGMGFDQGFMMYDDTMDEREMVRKLPERIAKHTTDRAIELLRWFHKDQFFMWIHYQDPHGPYTPPGNYGRMFINSERKPLILEVNPSVSGHGGIPSYQQLGPHRDLYYYISQHDGEIYCVDEHFKRLLSTLKQYGLYDDSLIIFSADHGENMGEQNYFFSHGENLNSSLTHVPLIIKYGKDFVGRRKDFVQHIDIFPTILKTIGIKADARFRGVDLFKEHENNREIFSEMRYKHVIHSKEISIVPDHKKYPYIIKFKKISIVLDSYKLIYTSKNKKYQLFNLKADPYEEQNLININDYQHRIKDLKTRLHRLDREDLLKISVNEKPYIYNKEELEKLKSLGYIR